MFLVSLTGNHEHASAGQGFLVSAPHFSSACFALFVTSPAPSYWVTECYSFLSQFCLCFLSLWSCSQPKIHRISKNKPRSSKIIQDHFFSDTNRLRSFMFFIHFHSSITSTFKQAHWNQAGFVRSWDVVPWPSKEGSLHLVMSDTPHIEAEPTGLCHGQMSAHEVTP